MNIPPIPEMTPPPAPSENDSRDKRPSLSKLAYLAKSSCRRFPVSVCYLIYALIISEMKIWDIHIDNSYFYTAILGVPLTLAVYLWCEPYETRRPGLKILAQVMANLLISGDLVYLLTIDRACNEAEITGHTVAVTASIIALFFTPAPGNALRKWTFTYRQLIAALIAFAVQAVAWMAFCMINLSVIALFNAPEGLLRLCFSISTAVIMPLTFIVFITSTPRYDTLQPTHDVSPIILAMVKYVLLPLTGLYMVVLYIYAATILFTWELPKGYITWSVTALIAEVLVVEFFLFPISTEKLNQAGTFIKSLVPILTIPLLLLMSVAIGYRIYEYGFTADRLYVLTFNIWCYVAMIGLYLTRCRHINWIPLSFSAIMLAVSIIPGLNYSVFGEKLRRTAPDGTEKTVIRPESVIADTKSKTVNERITPFSYHQPDDSVTPLPAGVTGFREFECEIDGIIPDKRGRVSIGISGARGRLNIDSILDTDDRQPLHPVMVKVPGNSGKFLMVTEVKGFTKQYDDSINGNCYAVKASVKGYVLDKQ